MSSINELDILFHKIEHASDDARKVVLLTPAQYDYLFEIIKNQYVEIKMLRTEVDNLLDRVNELEKQNKQVTTSEKTYVTSDMAKKFHTADRPKGYTSLF